MSDGMTINKQFRSSKDMDRVVNKLGEVLDGEDTFLVIMACLALVLKINKDDLTPDELDKGILGASEWISLYVTTLDMDNLPASKVN